MDVRFGDFRFNSGTRLLTRGPEVIHLTRKAIELLSLLLERRPDAVSKEEVHTRLWATTYVSEASLQGLISEIREALGDDARRPRFIRTAHGFGYAFCGPTDDAFSGNGRSQASAWLIGESGRLPLVEGVNVIGRSGADVIALDSPTVSRRHAQLVLGAEALLEDLGSKNGTILNERAVDRPTSLADGDRIRIGSFLFTFRVDRPADSTRTLSSIRPHGKRRARE